MLQVLDGDDPTWSKQLDHYHDVGWYPALLIKHASPSTLDVLKRYLAKDHIISLLSAEMNLVMTPGQLDLYEAQTLPQFSYLYSPPYSKHPALTELQRLTEIVAQLRSPQGCPWDREQTPESLTPYIIEEAYETVAAIQSGDTQAIAEELGDLLLQVVLQSQLFAESQIFDLSHVARGIVDKLIRRHPHVFGPEATPTLPIDRVHQNWDQIKQSEKPHVSLGQKLAHEAKTLPPLMAALKISKKVAKVGFEWPTVEALWAKVQEEEAEFREVLAVLTENLPDAELAQLRQRQSAELGDLLFTLVNVGRWYGLDASTALHQMNQRFTNRLCYMEQLIQSNPDFEGQSLVDFSLATLESLWQQAKQVYP